MSRLSSWGSPHGKSIAIKSFAEIRKPPVYSPKFSDPRPVKPFKSTNHVAISGIKGFFTITGMVNSEGNPDLLVLKMDSPRTGPTQRMSNDVSTLR